MTIRARVAVIALGCGIGVVVGARAERPEIETLELSQLHEGESWELASGDEVLRMERRAEMLVVTTVGAERDSPVQRLTCFVPASWCAIRLEASEALARIRLLKEDLDGREELVFEAGGGRLRLVGAAVSAARGVPDTRPGRSWQQQASEEAVGEQPKAESLLLCPEGDTWMRLSTHKATDSTYYCQHHGHRLELAGGAHSERRRH